MATREVIILGPTQRILVLAQKYIVGHLDSPLGLSEHVTIGLPTLISRTDTIYNTLDWSK